MKDNKTYFKKDEKNTYCISLNVLAQEGYLESPITLSSSDEDITSAESTKTVKIIYDEKFKYELVDECKGLVNPTPILYKGLTPVKYDEASNNWVVVDPKIDEWYNYDAQKWANAVVLGTDVIKHVGDTVAVDGTEAKMMLVWIPRYEYKYINLGNQYAGGTQAEPGKIEINFVLKNVKEGSTNEYKVHPAFTFGDQEVSGFWVGKFEISHETLSSSTSANNLGCNQNGCTSDISKLRILPNKPSLRYNNVSNFFYAIRSIESTNTFGLSNMDTHMMKNSEWGAVAYLSQSKYGKKGNTSYGNESRKIYPNKSGEYITGNGDQCSYNNIINNCGIGASTSGSIYGVYDMSGGAYEYVMGAYGTEKDPVIGDDSGFDALDFGENGAIDLKYYNIYSNINDSFSYDGSQSCNNNICYGHALSETLNWYYNSSTMVNSLYSWMIRGGNNTTQNPGIFGFNNIAAYGIYTYSTRPVFVLK